MKRIPLQIADLLREEEATTIVRLLASRCGLGAHGIRIYEEKDSRSLELHLEVDGSLDLDEAHRQATEFEHAVRRRFPGLARIVTHIEPAGDAAATRRTEETGQAQVREAIRGFLVSEQVDATPHDINVKTTGDELSVSFHCLLDATTRIADAHDFTDRFERYLRHHVRRLGRVVIHVEPASACRPAAGQ